jgi:hypothetical protein
MEKGRTHEFELWKQLKIKTSLKKQA